MSTLQIILLVFAILATLYEIMQFIQVAALIVRAGRVNLLPSWYLGMATAVAVQVAFILSVI